MRRALAVAIAVSALLAAPAAADQHIVAGPESQYLTTSVTMAQGERLTFENADLAGHDVTSDGRGPDGSRLFVTPIIGAGASALVEGSQYLTAGVYGFHCSVHPFMTGKLTVTSAGSPDVRPTHGDKRAPGIALQIEGAKLGSVQKSGKLSVSFRVDERSTVTLTGSEKAGGKSYALGKAVVQARANRTVHVALSLSRKGRAALAGRKKARFSVVGRPRDAAGNQGYGSATRTLTR